MTKHEKRLFNRYDQYETASIFAESAEDYLSKKLKGSWRRFIFRAILGVLLFINGYLSHWGPWTWPNNYYLIAFSVVFYHAATYVYGIINGVNNNNGHFIGDYVFGAEVRGTRITIGEDKQTYILQGLENDKCKWKVELPYTEYFTVDGYFLEQKYEKVLEKFVEDVKKNDQK